MIRNRDGEAGNRSRRGIGLVDVLVVVGIALFLLMMILTLLPRQREASRQATCQNNLRQIGVGLQIYQQESLSYPPVSSLDGRPDGPSPLSTTLGRLGLPSFAGLKDPTKRPGRSDPPAIGARIPGIVCPSDGRGSIAISPTSISYRANAGITPRGSGGPFSPGSPTSATSIDASKGLSFTAGFAERRLGTGLPGHPDPANYALVDAADISSTASETFEASRWHGDAGTNWAQADWQSTLYQHDRAPTLAPSTISLDRRSASMGASSYHPNQIHLMMLDGSVRVVAPTINRSIWRSLGAVDGPVTSP